MKRLLSATLLFIFIFSTCLSTLPHSNHPSDWGAQDTARRANNKAEESLWRVTELERLQDEAAKEDAKWGLFTTILNPAMGAIISASMALDNLFGGKKCPRCKESVDLYFDHRAQCLAGHWFWNCSAIERGNHRYCPDHPTDCRRCSGAGCYLCWDPDNDVPICLKCGASGAHHCAVPDPDTDPEPDPDPDPEPDPDPDEEVCTICYGQGACYICDNID